MKGVEGDIFKTLAAECGTSLGRVKLNNNIT